MFLEMKELCLYLLLLLLLDCFGLEVERAAEFSTAPDALLQWLMKQAAIC